MSRSNQKILVLGATGSICSPVVDVLLARGHEVFGLARSEAAANILRKKGVSVLCGDIRSPEDWLDTAARMDGIAHCAITWSDDMDAVDRRLVEALIEALSSSDAQKSLIYTSGCWNYGATGDTVATEESPFDSLAAFEPLMEMGEKVRRSSGLRGMVIHPAMVYDRDTGTVENMVEDARDRGQVRIIGDTKTRWTMVHRHDIATLYALMFEKAEAGAVYNGAGTQGIEVYKVAEAIAARFKNTKPPITMPVDEAVAEFGSWAKGYAIDQQMSSAKAIRELGWKPVHTDVLADVS